MDEVSGCSSVFAFSGIKRLQELLCRACIPSGKIFVLNEIVAAKVYCPNKQMHLIAMKHVIFRKMNMCMFIYACD